MDAQSWLPGALKEYLRHAPALLTHVVDWKTLSTEVGALSARLLAGKGVAEARAHLSPRLPPAMAFGTGGRRAVGSGLEQRIGDDVLRLYFTQVLGPGPFFLDLRASCFTLDSEALRWEPGNLWGEFSPAFAQGLRQLYGGFYGKDPQRFADGLLATGLTHADWSPEDRAHMAELLRAHFETANGAMHFKLENFQQSFQKVFEFMVQKKAKLGGDFLLLGILLLTLYLGLEELGQRHEVDRLYQEALAQLA